MVKRHKPKIDKPIRKLKRSTLLIGLAVGLAFSIIMGVTAGAIGLGSIYPQLNRIAEPLVCPGTTMSYSRRVSEIGTATYYTAEWFCVDERTGARNRAGVEHHLPVCRSVLRSTVLCYTAGRFIFLLELERWAGTERWSTQIKPALKIISLNQEDIHSWQ
jgi:hypothetical protein